MGKSTQMFYVHKDSLPGLTARRPSLYLYRFVWGSLLPCAGNVCAALDRSPTEGLMSAFMKPERLLTACGSPLGRGLA